MAGKWFKSWPRYPSRDSKLLQLWWLFIYDLPVDIGPRRWAFGRRRSGGDLPASSLPQSPVANGAAPMGSAVLLPRLQRPARPFVSTEPAHIQFKRKEKETKWLVWTFWFSIHQFVEKEKINQKGARGDDFSRPFSRSDWHGSQLDSTSDRKKFKWENSFSIETVDRI